MTKTPMPLLELRDAIAKAIADSVGHGMREKCLTQADAVLTVVVPELDATANYAPDAKKSLDAICDVFGIGSAARQHDVILTNVRNARRRSACLSSVEQEFFTKEVPDEDGDEGETLEECAVSWGAEPEEYLEQFRAALYASRVLTCVYCGKAYPQDTRTHGDSVLTEHIKVCVKHPLRFAEARIAALRGALEGLIGVSEPDALRQMEAEIRALPAPAEDKAVSINAIHALLATQEGEVQS